MNPYFLFLFLFTIISCANLIKNPSFESVNINNQPEYWTPPKGGIISTDEHLSGQNSYYWNTSTNESKYLIQPIEHLFESHFKYEICINFKLTNLNHFQNVIRCKNYTEGIAEVFFSKIWKGTTNWTRECYITNELIGKYYLYNFALFTYPQNEIGHVYIDDVSIYRIHDLLKIGINNDRDEVYNVLNAVYDINTTKGSYHTNNWEITTRIKDDNGTVYYEEYEKPNSSHYISPINITSVGLKDNNYYIIEGILESNIDDTIDTFSYPFKKIGKIKRKVEIDKYGRMFFDEKLFFPMGIYTTSQWKNRDLFFINQTHLNFITGNITDINDLNWLGTTFNGRIKVIQFVNFFKL